MKNQRLKKFDEFLNGCEKPNSNDEVNGNDYNKEYNLTNETKKFASMFITELNGVKYQFYEMRKKWSGLPIDILIGIGK